jgi:hypothetical protein
MHFVFLVPPVTPRGKKAHYLWTALKWIDSMSDEDASLILPRDYLEALKNQGTWEFGAWSKEFHGYNVWAENALRGMHHYFLDDEKLVRFAETHPNPHQAFLEYIFSERFALEYLAPAILEAQKEHGRIAVVTWLNCHSLKTLSREIGFDLIFNEIGPLRKPHYLQNAYFDFSGVNGDTSVQSDWARNKSSFTDWIQVAEIEAGDIINLLAPLTAPAMAATQPEPVGVGIALQVEDDSNILAHSNGWTSLSLLTYAQQANGDGNYRARLHPNGHALYRAPLDCSPSSLHFMRDSKEIWTINSSVGIESVFWGKPVRFFGDSPANFLPSPESDEYPHAWLYLFLCYLTPYSCLFDKEYYEWRLTQPTAVDIAKTHLQIYLHLAAAIAENAENASLPIDDGESCTVVVEGSWSAVLKERFQDRLAYHYTIRGEEPAADSIAIPGNYAHCDQQYYQQLHDTNPAFQENNWLLSEIETLTGLGAKHVIEMGCGNGKFLDAASPYFESLIGIDWAKAPNIQTVVDTHRNVRFIQADLINSFPETEPADLLVSADFLEHLPKEQLKPVLARAYSKAKFHFHKIACYDDGHSHLSILNPAEWLAIFKEISQDYVIFRLEERFGDASKLVCCITNAVPHIR